MNRANMTIKLCRTLCKLLAGLLLAVLLFQSLKSRGFVREQFAWRNYYWYLTNEGIQYLRDFLHLPAEIVPATLKRQTRPEAQRPRPKGG